MTENGVLIAVLRGSESDDALLGRCLDGVMGGAERVEGDEHEPTCKLNRRNRTRTIKIST